MAHVAPIHSYRILSCALCQQRKVRCDRQDPCSNCVKASVACVPSTPAPARPRRRPNQTLIERLARCESLLLQYSRSSAPLPPKQKSPLAYTTPGSTNDGARVNGQPADEDEHSRAPRPGTIVHHNSGPRFMDSPILATIYDELVGMQDLVETTSYELDPVSLSNSNNADLLLCGDDPAVDLAALRPDAAHVFRLWQLFLDRVNPLGKILHVPTVQPLIVQSAADMRHMPLQHQALIFAIYTIAVVSASEDESLVMFNMSRDEALSRFMMGAKLALIRFEFLHNFDMAALQALILYLWSIPGKHDRSRAWVLSGVVVRIAQKAGYHRDGEQLNLSPFETEMRRRIWWQIFVQDSTYAMASGFGPSLMPSNWDTKEPLNLNDADLYPSRTEPFTAREGPTEMAFCIILHRMYKLSTKIVGISELGEALLKQNGKALDQFRHAVSEMDADVRTLEERYIDPEAGNAHQAALTMRPMLLSKLSGMVSDDAEDSVFRTLLATLEHECECYDQMVVYRFEWAMKLHFQPDLLAAFVLQLAKRTGAVADRGWAIVERMYAHHPELFDMTHKQHVAQARSALRAWDSRAAVKTPAFITRLRERIAQVDGTCSSGGASMFPEVGMMSSMVAEVCPDILDWADFEPVSLGYEQ